MRRLLLTSFAVLAVLAIAPALSTTKPVDITQSGFTPNRVTVDFGDTVTWTNRDTGNHQVLADQMAFPTSPVLAANQAYSYTFTKSGSFGYRDALNTKRRGTVTVRAGISMTVAPPVVGYGQSATLSGLVSSAAAGETVTVDAMDCGKTTFARIASVTSAANGAWASPAKPVANTVYLAHWKNTQSAQLAEKVAPTVSLKRLRVGRFSAGVTAGQSFVGKYVVLQRYVRSRKAWKTVKRVTLRTAKAGVAPTVVTSAGFRARVARQTKLRLLLTQPQAGACYAAARSKTVKA
ncbi:MAG: cupredoxin domain-containing protein [Actinomycetota bacterium]